MQCEYCGKQFKVEAWFRRHKCGKKVLAEEVGEMGLLRAFNLFDRWYRVSGFSRKAKNLDQFVKSPYFRTFIDLQKFVNAVYLPSGTSYVDWLVHQNIPSKDWCKETVLSRYKKEHSRVEDAILLTTRSLEKIALWCDQKGVPMERFFQEIGPGEALNWIQSGKLSPWVFLLSKRADDLLDRMNENHITEIDKSIDISYWDARLKVSAETVGRVREMLVEIGL